LNKHGAGKQSAPDPRPQGGHGNHWQAVAGAADRREFGERALAEVLLGSGDPLVRGNVALYTTSPRPLAAIGLVQGGTLLSGYPAAVGGHSYCVNLHEVQEWRNGYEAVLIGSLNGALVSFFDTHYAVNKDRYTVGAEYDFYLNAIAYMVDRPEDEPFTDAEGFAAALPFSLLDAGGEADDWQLLSYPLAVTPVSYYGAGLWQIETILYKPALEVAIYLYANDEIMDHQPMVGEPIVANLWLQGYLKE